MRFFRENRLINSLNRLVSSHLQYIYVVTSKSPRIVLLSFMLLALLSVISICTIRFETDIFRLFPADRPALRLLLDSLEWSGGAREAYFLLEGDPEKLPGEASRLAERLRALKVDGSPAFNRVIFKMYEESEAKSFSALVAFAAAHPAAFVPPDRMDELAARLTPKGVDKAVGRLASEVAGSIGGSGSMLSIADPLFLRDFFLPRFKKGSQALDLDPASPYFISRDGRVLIMIAEPARPVQNMDFARKLVKGINQARQGAGVPVSCAGAHISAVIDEAAMKSNILSCIISSLIMVLGIFYLVYRRLLPTLMIPVILAAGVLFALGFAGLFTSSVHIISFAFMALIIGLGTDYSIHLYDRFHTERSVGHDTERAIQLAVTDTGHGIFTAAATTAIPFLSLGLSDVRALSELGVLVGLGVIFSLYSTLFLLPPIMRLMDYPDRIYSALPSLGIRFVWKFADRWPKAIFVAAFFLTVLFTVFAVRISFDGDLKNLQPQHSEAFRAQELVERHLNLAPKSMLVALDGKDPSKLLQAAIPLDEMAMRLYGEGRLKGWSSLGMTMNRSAEQVFLAEGLDRSAALGPILRGALARHGFDPAPFGDYLGHIEAGRLSATVVEGDVIASLAASPLRGVVERHLVNDNNGWHGLTYLYYDNGALPEAELLRLIADAVPGARVTGVELVSRELLEAVKDSAVKGVTLGSILVFLLLLSHFRDWAGIAATLGPVLFGAVAMLGAMVMTGMKLNFMNVMVLVTIVGMGSDYGMHIRHRCAEAGEHGMEAAFVQSGRSVLLSALTTIAGFGSLAFTDYGAMSSIGWATNFGIGFTLIGSLFFVTAALRLNKSVV